MVDASKSVRNLTVALLRGGAWIEILLQLAQLTVRSHVALLRGGAWIEIPRDRLVCRQTGRSHSFAGVRGLKCLLLCEIGVKTMSHSFAGVRGLKFFKKRPHASGTCVALLRGGAWIEIPSEEAKQARSPESHSFAGVRGLK